MTTNEAAQKTGEALAMLGQSGWPSIVANVGAVGVICYLVLVELPGARQQFREDVGRVEETTRAELRSMQTRDDSRNERLEAARERQQVEYIKSLEVIRLSVADRDKRLTEALWAQGRAVDNLTNELRRIQGLPLHTSPTEKP